MDVKKLLKGAQSKWKTAKKRAEEDKGTSGFTEIPDGRYTARLVSATVGESAKGRPQVDFGWKIEDGEYEGKTKHNYQGIESEDNLYYLGRDLDRLGYQLPDDLMDLPDILKDIEKSKPLGTINLVTKPGSDFQNLYIRKMFDSEEDEDEGDESDVETEEEETDDAEEESDEEEAEGDEFEEESEEEESDEESDDDADEEGEDEGGDDDEEEVSIEEGMRVVAETTKGREPGVVVGILEDEQKVRVKLDSGKTIRLDPEKIEVEPEEVKKPATKKPAAPAKKATPAPAKKSAPAKKPAASSKKPVKKSKR